MFKVGINETKKVFRYLDYQLLSEHAQPYKDTNLRTVSIKLVNLMAMVAKFQSIYFNKLESLNRYKNKAKKGRLTKATHFQIIHLSTLNII